MDLKEFFKQLGIELTEEQSKKVDEANENWIPMSRFNEVNNKFKEQQQMVADRDEQIKKLGESANSVEDYKSQIAQLTEANQKSQEEWTAKVRTLSQQNSFNSSVGKYHFKQKFLKQVNGMIDSTKLTEQENGWSGYDEKLAKIAEDYPEFVETQIPQNAGESHDGKGISETSLEDEKLRRVMGLPPKK